ncbi:MAG: hypothetical protein ACJ8M1_08295 [Chthoniobacterales bacterium]
MSAARIGFMFAMHLSNPNITSNFLRRPVHPRRLTYWAIAAATALAAIPTAFADPSFFLTELPKPAGYESSAPYQINDQGFVVGLSNGATG